VASFVKLEQLQYDYRDLLKAHLPAALDDVEAYWQGKGDPLSLPDIGANSWYTGNFTEQFIGTVVQKLPAITVEATSLGPTPDKQTLIGEVNSLVVTIYAIGQKPGQADKLVHRYAAAIAAVIADRDNKPSGVKSVGAISMVVGETTDLPRANYFKDAQVTATLRIGAEL
jgi:hypothetical protein